MLWTDETGLRKIQEFPRRRFFIKEEEKMNVKLMNDLVVKYSLEKIGQFASICKNGELPTREHLIKIGKSCMRQGHFSTCRGIMWHFQITGISRVCSHQLVRHHVGIAINQASNVYQEANSKVVLPYTVQGVCSNEPELEREIHDLFTKGQQIYTKLRERGIATSDSRYLLPQGLETSIIIALTPEALIHLCHERLCSKAQWEIRGVVQRMVKQIIKIEPFWGELLVPKCIYLNGCPEALGCGYYNSKVNMTNVGEPVAHIEQRLNVFKCDSCGRQLMYKDDDQVPIVKVGDKQWCRECYRKYKEEVAEGEDDNTTKTVDVNTAGIRKWCKDYINNGETNVHY